MEPSNGKKSVKGIGKGWRKSGPAVNGNTVGLSEEVTKTGAEKFELDKARTELLAERQVELDKVLDQHDDFVREAFHLEKFVSLIWYDPTTAKQDNSEVWQQFKAHHDLLDKTPTSSRRTRRAQTERLQSLTLKGSTSSPQLTSNSSKRKSQPIRRGPLKSPSKVYNSVGVKVKSKEKGKTKAEVDETQIDDDLESEEGADEYTTGLNGSAKLNHGGERDTTTLNALIPMKRSMTYSKSRKRRKTELTTFDKFGELESPAGSSKRVDSQATDDRTEFLGHRGTNLSELIDENTTTSSMAGVSEINGGEVTAPELPKPSKILRVKLVVRAPPPTYSNPLQRPPVLSPKPSLDTFINSFVILNGTFTTEEALSNAAETDAKILNRIVALQKEGRFLDTSAFLSGSSIHSSSGKGSLSGVAREPDVWDHIVTEIVTSRKTRTRHFGRLAASQVASKIQAYWDGQATRKDKEKMHEEKKVRMLAKSTIKLVVAEWKKAVLHIREQERLAQVAEELRMGQKHLDAILDQSGHILETQHVDLARGGPSNSRSRSGSVASSLGGWDDSDEEDSEEGAGSGARTEDEGEVDGNDGSQPLMVISPKSVASILEEAHEVPETPSEGEFLETVPRESGTPGDLDEPQTIEGSDDEDEDEADTRNLLGGSFNQSRSRSESNASSDKVADQDGSQNSQPASGPVINQNLSMAKAEELTMVPKNVEANLTQLNVEPTISTTAAVVEKQSGLGDTMMDLDPSTSEEQRLVDNVPDDEDLPEGGAQAGHAIKEGDSEQRLPEYLRAYAVTPVDWDTSSKVTPPLLLRGSLRPYQLSGLDWLASLHTNRLNGILADEMGLGKTIQTISLLAHLACDRGIWGPHLIIVPTSVLLNWEMEFKKFLPGFRVLSYHGTTKRRKELRQGWNDKFHFNVCITSYNLASKDAHIFKRKAWYYMILDEAHMIKNFKSQRWNILLMFRSYRRLLLTGTPLQNNLTELWALLQFLMSGANFANLKEFGEWFSNPLEKAIEMGNILDDETMQRVSKLHTVLRPYLLRRLKKDVEKELPQKHDHLVLCPLSKRQRLLYDEFMSRGQTKESLASGVYQKIANILMQLRKVCNHPDLFEVRPIVTSFAMEKSAIASYEIKELLVRRRLLWEEDEKTLNLDVLGLKFIDKQNTSIFASRELDRLDATDRLPVMTELSGVPPPKDVRTIVGYKKYASHKLHLSKFARWSHARYLNRLRCKTTPIYGEELIRTVQRFYRPIHGPPQTLVNHLDHGTLVSRAVKSFATRAEEMSSVIDRFAFVTPAVVALDLPFLALPLPPHIRPPIEPSFDALLHPISVKLQVAFPDPSLLQYDCGKMQELARLLREKKRGGHRILIFTQMTRILDLLEIFLNFHGWLYLRLDGGTKIEDRQYITERFNADERVFCFIASSRSGGVGINLTGADTVIFYDSDFNPQMDRQCEDRAHRIGQIRDVHIYRFISKHTVEEAMLRKANQKRALDNLVIQKGEFDWRSLFSAETADGNYNEGELEKALGEVEDGEDAAAAQIAAREARALMGADDDDFGVGFDSGEAGGEEGARSKAVDGGEAEDAKILEGEIPPTGEEYIAAEVREVEGEEEEGGTTVDFMLKFVQLDMEFFRDWR